MKLILLPIALFLSGCAALPIAGTVSAVTGMFGGHPSISIVGVDRSVHNECKCSAK